MAALDIYDRPIKSCKNCSAELPFGTRKTFCSDRCGRQYKKKENAVVEEQNAVFLDETQDVKTKRHETTFTIKDYRAYEKVCAKEGISMRLKTQYLVHHFLKEKIKNQHAREKQERMGQLGLFEQK